MDFKSKLEIIDWKKDVVPLSEPKPELIDYCISDYDQSKFLGKYLEYLKYFDEQAEWNVENLNSKFDICGLKPSSKHYYLLASFISNLSGAATTECQFVTYASVLHEIMNTPFETNNQKRKWHLKARVHEGNSPLKFFKILLYSEADEIRSTDQYNVLLNKHFFLRKPHHFFRRLTTNTDYRTYEAYKINLSCTSVVYLADDPGITSYKTISTIYELKQAEHVITDVIPKDGSSQDLTNYPSIWSKAALIKAKQCIVGIYNEDNNNLEDIVKVNTDVYNDKTKYENLWSPTAAWNFLDVFLSFVANEVDKLYLTYGTKLFQLEFTSFPDDKPCVTCEFKVER